MAKQFNPGKTASDSPEVDVRLALFGGLREARLNRGLSQQELARRLGFHQRQISDLERAAVDPRLATVQNVARALDLELMLIPRHLIPAVEGLQQAGAGFGRRPVYALDEDAEPDADGQPRIEVGGVRDPGDRGTRRRRRPKHPR